MIPKWLKDAIEHDVAQAYEIGHAHGTFIF